MSVDDDQPSVEDPSGYNQRRRLESINNFRENVLAAYSNLPYQELPDAEDQEWARMVTFRRHVEAFLFDIKQLVANRGGDAMYTTKLGEITLDPPERIQEDKTDIPYRIVEGYRPEPKTWEIIGLYSHRDIETDGIAYVDAPDTFSHEWEVLFDDGDVGAPVTAVSEMPMPWDVSMNAYDLATYFLNKHDFDARLEPADYHSEEPGL